MAEPLAPNSVKIKIERIAAWLFVFGFIFVSLLYFSSFFQPVILALMIWYLIYVLKDYGRRIRIKGKELPEWLLTTLAFILIILVSYGMVEIVMTNLELIINRTPLYIERSKVVIEEIKNLDGFHLLQDRLFSKISDFDLKPLLTGLLNGLSGFAGNIFMIVIYVGFLLAEEKTFNKKMNIMMQNRPASGNAATIIQEINEAVRTYVWVKTQMSLLTGILSYFVLLLFGVDFPILWAFLIFLLNYIPYIGSLLATLLPALFSILQFESFAIAFWVFFIIQGIQVVVGNVLEPKVMGKTLNLSPLGVLLALTFWGIMWGILGMIISVPITSIMVIVASRIPNLRFLAIWLSESGELGNNKVHPVEPEF